jgi:hypothetical protein
MATEFRIELVEEPVSRPPATVPLPAVTPTVAPTVVRPPATAPQLAALPPELTGSKRAYHPPKLTDYEAEFPGEETPAKKPYHAPIIGDVTGMEGAPSFKDVLAFARAQQTAAAEVAGELRQQTPVQQPTAPTPAVPRPETAKPPEVPVLAKRAYQPPQLAEMDKDFGKATFDEAKRVNEPKRAAEAGLQPYQKPYQAPKLLEGGGPGTKSFQEVKQQYFPNAPPTPPKELVGPPDPGEEFREAQKRLERKRRAQRIKSHELNVTEGPADLTETEDAAPETAPESGLHQLLQQFGGKTGNALSKVIKHFGGGGSAGATPPTAATPVSAGGATTGAAAEGAGAAEAGGLAGLASGAMAAAPLIGAALVIGEKVKEAIKGVLAAPGAIAQGVAAPTIDIAKGNNMEGVMKAADGAATALGKIPLVGEFLETGLKSAVQVVRAFTSVVDAFVERGKFLAQYSPELQAANVGADIRSMLGDIREAQELGPGLARLTDAQSQLGDDLREMLLPIKQWIIEKLSGIMESLHESWPEIQATLAGSWEALKRFTALFEAWATGHLPNLVKEAIAIGSGDIGKAYDEALRKAKDRSKNDPVKFLIEKQQQQLDQLARAAEAFGRVNLFQPDGGLDVPAFNLGM